MDLSGISPWAAAVNWPHRFAPRARLRSLHNRCRSTSIIRFYSSIHKGAYDVILVARHNWRFRIPFCNGIMPTNMKSKMQLGYNKKARCGLKHTQIIRGTFSAVRSCAVVEQAALRIFVKVPQRIQNPVNLQQQQSDTGSLRAETSSCE